MLVDILNNEDEIENTKEVVRENLREGYARLSGVLGPFSFVFLFLNVSL